MAARYFIPTSGDYAWDGAVWAATSTGAAGSAATPVSTDEVYILSGTANIVSSLNQSAVFLESLTIGFGGTIGTDSASLSISFGASKFVRIYGGSRLYLALDGTALRVDVDDSFRGALTLGSGDIDAIFCGTNGSVALSGTTIGGGVTTAGCPLTLNTGTTFSAAFVIAYGGNHVSYVDITTLYVHGRNTSFSMVGVNANTYVSVLSGATFYFDSFGTITNAEVYPDSKMVAVGNYGGFTVTNSELWITGRLFESPSVPITYTFPTVKIGYR